MKAYTDIEQSKKLAEILPLESADMHWQDASKEYENPYGIYDRHFRLVAGNSSKIINNKHDFRKGFILPAWSLAALLKVIPKKIKDFNVLRIDINEKDFSIWYDEIGSGVNTELPDITMECPVDACYEMIIRLNELKML